MPELKIPLTDEEFSLIKSIHPDPEKSIRAVIRGWVIDSMTSIFGPMTSNESYDNNLKRVKEKKDVFDSIILLKSQLIE